MLVNEERGRLVAGSMITAVPNGSATSILLSTNSFVSRMAASRFGAPMIAWKPSGSRPTASPERDSANIAFEETGPRPLTRTFVQADRAFDFVVHKYFSTLFSDRSKSVRFCATALEVRRATG